MPAELWKIPSLVDILRQVFPPAYVDAAPDAKNDDDDDDGGSILESELELKEAAVSPQVNFFIRDVDSLAAPIVATRYLTSMKIFQKSTSLHVSLLSFTHPTLPAENNTTAQNKAIRSEITALLTGWRDRNVLDEERHTAITKIVDGTKLKLEGRFHCEAGIMALLYAKLRGPDQEENPLRESEFPLTIGVSKKCCPICWELGQILSADFELSVALPGTHSVFSFWIPPSWLPDNVLAKLELVLLEKLRLMTTPPPLSNQSSPSSAPSASGDEDDFSYLDDIW
ncbi:hypothetical protein EUX98_g6645 [Antrodiella citrinella]|uniref:Uncharacterized protein n=1 Tax=Antrodiella citrinella TaxID=2447956 RepID=A0A4S4MNM4_9APHY|nr:hypothetical protein EUX98_g6645 [Antrodiella citrinella]